MALKLWIKIYIHFYSVLKKNLENDWNGSVKMKQTIHNIL